MQLSKKDFIQKLYDIEENENISTGRMVQKVIRNEIIPIDVIKFINEHDNKFLKVYDTYNTIYNSRQRNPLYSNLRNENLSLDESVIAISSLITRILISCSKINDEQEKQIFITAMNLDNLLESIKQYEYNKDEKLLVDCLKQVRELLSILYKKGE